MCVACSGDATSYDQGCPEGHGSLGRGTAHLCSHEPSFLPDESLALRRYVLSLSTHLFSQTQAHTHAFLHTRFANTQQINSTVVSDWLLSPGSSNGQNIPMNPMPLPPPPSMGYSVPPPPSNYGHQTPAANGQMLDYMEKQMRGMDMTSPMLQVSATLTQSQHYTSFNLFQLRRNFFLFCRISLCFLFYIKGDILHHQV